LDSAFYTLIGALGGILITQVANYFLEDKKSKNLIQLKSLELQHTRHHDLLKERRKAYAKYLEEVDMSRVAHPSNLTSCVASLYGALIVATDDTTKDIKAVFSILRQDEIGTDEFLNAKRGLLTSMQKDLQD